MVACADHLPGPAKNMACLCNPCAVMLMPGRFVPFSRFCRTVSPKQSANAADVMDYIGTNITKPAFSVVARGPLRCDVAGCAEIGHCSPPPFLPGLLKRGEHFAISFADDMRGSR